MKESAFLIIYPDFPSISCKVSTFLWSFLLIVESRRILISIPPMIPELDSLEWRLPDPCSYSHEAEAALNAPPTCRALKSAINLIEQQQSQGNHILFFFCHEGCFKITLEITTAHKSPPYIMTNKMPRQKDHLASQNIEFMHLRFIKKYRNYKSELSV